MKKITIIIAAAILTLFLASCSAGRVVYDESSKSVKGSPTGASWTVMVYMCGGSAEEERAAATDKLEQMMSIDYPENVNVIVQTGGSSRWHTKGVYPDYSQRFEMGRGTMFLADQSLAANMGDYKTLRSFLSWGAEKYKADNYMLILSGAGGGALHGMAFDALSEGDSLNLEEISYAISLSGINFDIIGFDSSLMCSLETASALYTCGEYMVASQEFQSPEGWDYAGVLKHICANPSAQPADICKTICDTYYAKCMANGYDADATMTAVNMSKISTLTQAFDGMAGDMLTTADDLGSYAALSDAIEKTVSYGGATADEGYSNLRDLGDMAMNVSGHAGSTADLLITALNDAVEYRVCGSHCGKASGMSVYYPAYAESEELQEYMEICTSVKYKEFLKKTCIDCAVEDDEAREDYTSSWAWRCYDNDMQWLEYKSILENDTYSLNILGNMDLFREISVDVYKKDKKTGKYLYLGKSISYSPENSPEAWESGIFDEKFNAKMPRLYGKPVTIRSFGKNVDEQYETCSVPVMLNGERSNIRIRRSYTDSGSYKYEILGAWDGLDERGSSGEGMKKVGFFDRITPLYAVYDENHEISEYIAGPTWFKTLGAMTQSNVESGDYMLEFVLTDIYGHKRYGTPVEGTVRNGNISFN